MSELVSDVQLTEVTTRGVTLEVVLLAKKSGRQRRKSKRDALTQVDKDL